MRKIAIIQPSYIPWRGYFDFIHEVDVFVFLDDVQHTARDWRNRNRIKTRDGKTLWLTVPILGGRNQLISNVLIDNTQQWQRKHLGALHHNYSKTPHFERYYEDLKNVYDESSGSLSELDIALTRLISGWLGIDTEFAVSSMLDVGGSKDHRLLQLVEKLEGTSYLSGPAAKAYIQPDLWENAGIELEYKDYSGFPVYPQISEPFEGQVTILDLLFMKGPDAPDYIWGKFRTPANRY